MAELTRRKRRDGKPLPWGRPASGAGSWAVCRQWHKSPANARTPPTAAAQRQVPVAWLCLGLWVKKQSPIKTQSPKPASLVV